MTARQKTLLTMALILASLLFMWPASILIVWWLALINGDIPTIKQEKEVP